MKIASNLDLLKNQLLNVAIHNVTVFPTAPVKGQLVYHQTDKLVYFWDETAWQPVGEIIEDGDGVLITSSGKTKTISIKVDNATIEITADTVAIKDQGVSTAKLKDANVTTIKVADKAISFAKMQDLTTMTVMGRLSGTGSPQAIPFLNENDFVSNSATAIATQASTRAYIDSRLAAVVGAGGSLIGQIDANALTNFPSSGATLKGDYWYVTTAGTIQGIVFNIGDVIIANKAAAVATNPNDFIFLESNRDKATTTVLGLLMLATQAEVDAGTNTEKAVTPATLAARIATEARTGLIEIATQAETNAGTDDARAVTPLKLKAYFDQKTGTYIANIGNASAVSFAVSHNLNTKDVTVDIYDNATGESIITDTLRNTVNQVTVTFGASAIPTTNQYRVIIRKAA